MKSVTEEAKSGRIAAEDEMFRTYSDNHHTNCIRRCKDSKKFGALYYGVRDTRSAATYMSHAIEFLDGLDDKQIEKAYLILCAYFESEPQTQAAVDAALCTAMERRTQEKDAYEEASCET